MVDFEVIEPTDLMAVDAPIEMVAQNFLASIMPVRRIVFADHLRPLHSETVVCLAVTTAAQQGVIR